MTEAQRIECVRSGQASLRELVEGLLDGSDDLRKASSAVLKKVELCQLDAPTSNLEERKLVAEVEPSVLENRKRRHGLPEGYVPRLNRHQST